jgi:hypothetical protein
VTRAHSADSTPGTFALAAIALSAAFLVAAVIVPGAAAALLRALVVALALGYVVARAHGAVATSGLAHDRYSPFDNGPPVHDERSRPAAIQRLIADLEPANRPRRARRTPIPRRVRWRLVDEAHRRLAEHHGLRLEDPRHHPRIRALVGDATWSLVEPRAPSVAGDEPPGAPAGSHGRSVPVSQLPSILDDMEKL